jgi:hypothetical protein
MKRLLCIMALVCTTATVYAKQMQPDPKRVHQIQARLVEHGYPATTTWAQAQEVLRDIARQHGWQTHHAPDARVLILLGLGNKYSDPDVALAGTNHLDYKKTQDPEAEEKP